MIDKKWDMIADWAVAIGAVNWGAVGLFKFNLVQVVSTNPTFLMVVYGAIGAAGAYKLGKMLSWIK